MKFFTTAFALLAGSAVRVMAAPLPSTVDTSIEARSFFDSIIHGVESVVKPIVQPITGILGGFTGGNKQPQQEAAPQPEVDPSQQLWRIDENGNATPVQIETPQRQAQEESGGGGFLSSITSGITNIASGVAGKVGGLIGGDEGAETASSIVGGIGGVATEVAPIAEEVAPLALAVLKE